MRTARPANSGSRRPPGKEEPDWRTWPRVKGGGETSVSSPLVWLLALSLLLQQSPRKQRAADRACDLGVEGGLEGLDA